MSSPISMLGIYHRRCNCNFRSCLRERERERTLLHMNVHVVHPHKSLKIIYTHVLFLVDLTPYLTLNTLN